MTSPIPTVPASVAVTGSNFNIPVVSTNLDPNVLVKDFVVQNINTGEILNNNNFVKTSPGNLFYNGVSLPANTTLRVFRRTAVERYEEITYAARFDSATYNEEITRILKMIAERQGDYSVIAGNSNIVVNEPFGPTWEDDVFRARTANTLYAIITSLQADIAQNANNIGTGDVNVTSLQQQIDLLDSAIAALQNLTAQHTTDIAGLMNSIASLIQRMDNMVVYGTQELLLSASSVQIGVPTLVRFYGTAFIGDTLTVKSSDPQYILLPASVDGYMLELSANVRFNGAHNNTAVGFRITPNPGTPLDVFTGGYAGSPANDARVFARHWMVGNGQSIQVLIQTDSQLPISGDFAVKVHRQVA